MWEAVAFTVVASAGNNIGKVLQKQGTKSLPQLSLKFKVIQSYLSSGTWLTGVVVDVLGGLLMLRAVSQAPVSVVQPVSGVGLAVLAVFSHFYLRESMHTLDWLAVTLAAAGTIGVGITGEEQEKADVSILRLLFFVVFLMVFFFLLNLWTHAGRQQHPKPHEVPGSPLSGLSGNTMDVMDEMSAGLQAGAFFGLSAVVCKLGFIMAKHEVSPLCIPAGIAGSVACSAGGFFCQTRGLRDGRAVVVSTCAAVASIVTGVLVGFLALGETLPVSPVARVFLCLGWIFILLGIILLLTSEKIGRNLPRPLRRFIRTKSTLPGRPRSSQMTMPVVNPAMKSPPKYRP